MSFATVLAPVSPFDGVFGCTYVTTKTSSCAATIAMVQIQAVLDKTIAGLSDQNYEQSFASLRLSFEVANTHSTIPPDAILHALQRYYTRRRFPANLTDPTLHLILRFAVDAESDHILGPYSTELRSRLCLDALRSFFNAELEVEWVQQHRYTFPFADANLIAHCINLGYVDEAVIRKHILQSLISNSTLHNHQVHVLVMMFKIAGATLAAYVDPTVIDRCFELLKGPRNIHWPKEELIQVNTLSMKGETSKLRRNCRRSLSYGSVAGRLFLPHPYSPQEDQSRPV